MCNIFVVTMNGELFEIMVIRLSHTPSDLSTENSIKLSLTLELNFLDHGLIIESIFLYLDHGLLFWWILISRISGTMKTTFTTFSSYKVHLLLTIMLRYSLQTLYYSK